MKMHLPRSDAGYCALWRNFQLLSCGPYSTEHLISFGTNFILFLLIFWLLLGKSPVNQECYHIYSIINKLTLLSRLDEEFCVICTVKSEALESQLLIQRELLAWQPGWQPGQPVLYGPWY